MKVGSLGDIIFEVSENAIKTLQDATWGGSVNIQSHDRHLANSLQEFCGIEPDSFTFNMVVSKYLGVNPIDVISQIFTYERNGTALPLVIGTKAYGKYRWLIKNHKSVLKNYDKYGDVSVAEISVTLTEYTEG